MCSADCAVRSRAAARRIRRHCSPRLEAYPGGLDRSTDLGGVAVPLEVFALDGRLLKFLSTVTTFGTALDLTAAEMSIEAFLPADDDTAEALRDGLTEPSKA